MEVLSIKKILDIALEEWHNIVCLLICFYRNDVGKTQTSISIHQLYNVESHLMGEHWRCCLILVSLIFLQTVLLLYIIGLFYHTHPSPSPTLYKEHPKHQTKTNKQNKQNNTKKVNTGTCNQIFPIVSILKAKKNTLFPSIEILCSMRDMHVPYVYKHIYMYIYYGNSKQGEGPMFFLDLRMCYNIKKQ